MKFRIWTILWAFALLASAMATFGGFGLIPGIVVLGFWALTYSQPKLFVSEWLLILLLTFIIAALLLPAVQSARESARRISCVSNLKQLALSILTYSDSHGVLPKHSQAPPQGAYPHSWRVSVHPYFGSSPFRSQYRENEPWNSTHNADLVSKYRFHNLYHCPSHPAKTNQAHYLAIVGEQAAWHPDRGRQFKEFTDGTSNTIMLIEAPHKKISWAQPKDLTFDEAIELLTTSPSKNNFGHKFYEGFFFKPSRGIYAATVDGAVHPIKLPISRTDAIAGLTLAGGELADTGKPFKIRDLKWLGERDLNYKRIYSLGMFIVLSLLPATKFQRKISSGQEQLELSQDQP